MKKIIGIILESIIGTIAAFVVLGLLGMPLDQTSAIQTIVIIMVTIAVVRLLPFSKGNI